MSRYNNQVIECKIPNNMSIQLIEFVGKDFFDIFCKNNKKRFVFNNRLFFEYLKTTGELEQQKEIVYLLKPTRDFLETDKTYFVSLLDIVSLLNKCIEKYDEVLVKGINL
jgi:hypothetical protein